jgi:hypothetical protein
MAEAITLSGQMIIKKSGKETNDYVNRLLKNKDYKNYLVYTDTDSVVGDTEIYSNGEKKTIEAFYDSITTDERILGEDNFIKSVHGYDTLSVFDSEVVATPIVYVMKHKVKKKLYKLSIGNKSVVITEDHSLVVMRSGELISIKPKDIDPADELLYLTGSV